MKPLLTCARTLRISVKQQVQQPPLSPSTSQSTNHNDNNNISSDASRRSIIAAGVTTAITAEAATESDSSLASPQQRPTASIDAVIAGMLSLRSSLSNLHSKKRTIGAIGGIDDSGGTAVSATLPLLVRAPLAAVAVFASAETWSVLPTLEAFFDPINPNCICLPKSVSTASCAATFINSNELMRGMRRWHLLPAMRTCTALARQLNEQQMSLTLGRGSI
ncbi:hypothetical protein ACLKA7_012041 [Drosophila subpalustris]